MGFLGNFSKFSSSIRGAFSWFIMFLSIAIILTVTVFVIKHVHITWIAVIISTICSCFLMVPVTLGFNNFVDSRVGKKEKILENQAVILKQNIVIEGLENTIRNLESTMFNVQGFEKILELGLLETNLKQPTIIRKRFNENYSDGMVFGIGAGGEYYEYLEVMTHDIVAKFGVDLKSMRLSNSKQHSDTIVVSGITAKFLGTTKNDPNWEVQEIRRIKLGGNKEPEKIDIMDSKQYQKLIIEHMQESQRIYQQRLNQGLETTFMDESVIKLAENFIKLVLAPLNKNIIFSDRERDDGILLLEYLDVEKQSINTMLENKKRELLSISNV
jgi:hypothetical protein